MRKGSNRQELQSGKLDVMMGVTMKPSLQKLYAALHLVFRRHNIGPYTVKNKATEETPNTITSFKST